MDLMQAINVSASGMAAQSTRMKMIAENIANKDSVVTDSGEAYRRKQIIFKAEVDRQTGLTNVKVQSIKDDIKTPLKKAYEPSHPLADAKGFVTYTNVNGLVESMDLKQAGRMYEANMQAIETAKGMMSRSLDLLR